MKFNGLPSRNARSVSSRATSISESPGGTPGNAAVFRADGISSNRSSIDCAPMTCSMRAMSSAVCGMNGMANLPGFLEELRILGRRQPGAGRSRCVGHDAHQPTGPVGIAIEQFRTLCQIIVAGGDLTRDRAIDIGCGLDGFDHGAGLARDEASAHLRNFDEHQVPERLLRVIGDAHLHLSAWQPPNPLVTSRVVQITRYLAHSPISFVYTGINILPLRTNGGFTTRA